MQKVNFNFKALKLDFWFWIKALALGMSLLFLVYPFSSLIWRSFIDPNSGGLSLSNFVTFFTVPYYYQPLFNSIYVTLLTTVISVVIGVPMAYLLSRYAVRGKKLIHIFIIMSLMSPPFLGAYAWVMLFGRAGVVTQFFANYNITLPSIYGPLGIISVFVIKMFPYVYLYVAGAMAGIDSSLEEAAENLGSNKLRRILTVTLPVVLPSIAAGAFMVFVSTLADFGTPALLGEGYRVLPVAIYDEYFSEIGGDANLASALSMIIVLVALGILFLQKYVVNKKNYVMSMLRPPVTEKMPLKLSIFVHAFVYLVTVVSLLPQIVVVILSFKNTNGPLFVDGFGFGSYLTILRDLSQTIFNTYYFSFVAILIIVLLGMLVSYLIIRKKSFSSSLLDNLIVFPYVIPGSVLGIALIVAFNKAPLILTATPLIMIVSYVVRKLPYTVRSGSAFLQQMDPSVEEASINLGVSPMKTFWKVTARLMIPGILAGSILSWITCINELSSSIMLYTGSTQTIAVAVYTEVARSSYGTAAALATILTLTTMLSLVLFMIIGKDKASVI